MYVQTEKLCLRFRWQTVVVGRKPGVSPVYMTIASFFPRQKLQKRKKVTTEPDPKVAEASLHHLTGLAGPFR